MTLISFVSLVLIDEPIYVKSLMCIMIYVIIKSWGIIAPHDSSRRMLESYVN